MEKCFLCDQMANVVGSQPLEQIYDYTCPNCGRFSISSDFKNFFNIKQDGHVFPLLSGYIREMNELGKYDVYISMENYKDILASPLIPHTIGAKLEKLILHYYKKTKFFGEEFEPDFSSDYSICYANNEDEAESLFFELVELSFAKQSHFPGRYSLTLEGIQHAEHITNTRPSSNTCFVAMWFATEMNDVYEHAIKPAIEDKSNYDYIAIQVGKKEHNNDITDEIIAGIRECSFMIADMTGYRGGVYFEAGFAKGLGKQVIFTCRQDWFSGETDKDGKVIKEKVHFDIDHQNIIVWETKEELKKRIVDRIRATIF